MSEYIRTNKFDTNECPNIFVKEKLTRTNVRIYIQDQYIRIFQYSNIFVTLWHIYPSTVCIWSTSVAISVKDLYVFYFREVVTDHFLKWWARYRHNLNHGQNYRRTFGVGARNRWWTPRWSLDSSVCISSSPLPPPLHHSGDLLLSSYQKTKEDRKHGEGRSVVFIV